MAAFPSTQTNLAVREFGAAGVASFANETGNPIEHPDEIAWMTLGGGRGGAAATPQKTTSPLFSPTGSAPNSPSASKGHETLNVRALVQATEYDADMQVPTAIIKGMASRTKRSR